MGTDKAVAPKERINIVYKSDIDGAQEEKELPLKVLVLGSFSDGRNAQDLVSRQPVPVDQQNISDVMNEMQLSMDFVVEDELSGKDAMLAVSLPVSSVKDFSPDHILQNVEPLRQLMELRHALTMLKGPMGNSPEFRARLKGALIDEGKKKALEHLCADTEQEL